MKVLDALQKLGGKLGLIQVAEAPPEPSEAPTQRIVRTVTVKELAGEVTQQQAKALAELPAEMEIPFEEAFAQAKLVPPPHGRTVAWLLKYLETPQCKGMERTNAQAAILGALSADGAAVEDVVKDALSRDQILDLLEQRARQKLEERMHMRERTVAELDEKTAELQAQKARLRSESKEDRLRWKEWRTKKVFYEKEMIRALSYLVEKAPVTTDAEPGGAEEK